LESRGKNVMGHGDDIIATGMARGARDRGKRIAFGDGRRIVWGPFSAEIFRNNPNIAPPGSEKDPDIEWVHYCKGHRVYNKQGPGRWIWNYDFKVKPGEIFFSPHELVDGHGPDLIMIDPNIAPKPCAPNKQWSVDRWKQVADELICAGMTVRQFDYGGPNLIAPGIKTPSFRDGMALLSRARLAILHEGGLHHAAAALGVPAIVLFGGFVPPQVLGYDVHTNLTGGATACGSFTRCQHCIDAMNKISVNDVLDGAETWLS
jgi:hypothetical protein